MRPKLIWSAGLVALTLLGIGGGLLLGFMPWPLSTSETSRPACGALPSRAEVDSALGTHQRLAEQIRSVDKDITVMPANVCGSSTDQAVLLVTYADASERKRIDAILSRSSGFGVPVQLRER